MESYCGAQSGPSEPSASGQEGAEPHSLPADVAAAAARFGAAISEHNPSAAAPPTSDARPAQPPDPGTRRAPPSRDASFTFSTAARRSPSPEPSAQPPVAAGQVGGDGVNGADDFGDDLSAEDSSEDGHVLSAAAAAGAAAGFCASPAFEALGDDQWIRPSAVLDSARGGARDGPRDGAREVSRDGAREGNFRGVGGADQGCGGGARPPRPGTARLRKQPSSAAAAIAADPRDRESDAGPGSRPGSAGASGGLQNRPATAPNLLRDTLVRARMHLGLV